LKTKESDVKKLARNFLESLPNEHVIEQLRNRNIGGIKFFCDDKDGSLKARNPGLGKIFLDQKTGKFTILASHNDSVENFCLILGHELGHTFSSLWTGSGKPLTKSAYFNSQSDEEDFCEAFAEMWLRTRNNRRESKILFSCLSHVAKHLDLESPDAENIIRITIGDKADRGDPGCLCSMGCDCENPEPENDGVALASNECPVHNLYPDPNPECPIHS